MRDFPAFARAFPQRFAYLLLGQWTPVPADLMAYVTAGTQLFFLFVALGAIAILAWAMAPLLRRDALARFWVLGMLLSLVPVTATFASNRLLMCAGLGGMGLLAQFLVAAFAKTEPLKRVRVLAWLLVVTHLGLAPLGLALGAASVHDMGRAERDAADTVPHPPEISDQDLVILNAPDYLFYIAHIPALKQLDGHPYARRMRPLAPTPVPLIVKRIDERTLDIRMNDGLFAGPLSRLFRGPRKPLRSGDRIELGDWRVTVIDAAPDGDVRQARFEFTVPLEDASLRWVCWEDDGYVPFEPPAVGESVRLPAALGLLDQF
jgi:hypothetical protein